MMHSGQPRKFLKFLFLLAMLPFLLEHVRTRAEGPLPNSKRLPSLQKDARKPKIPQPPPAVSTEPQAPPNAHHRLAQATPDAPPNSTPVARDTVDPFSLLKVLVPREKLGPITSVRIRDRQEEEDRSREGEIAVKVESMPKGAVVLYAGKVIGKTPFVIQAKRGSTPLDVVIKYAGFMTLRTRIRRDISRKYFYKLTPAKLQ
jgi:hypothetical protein